MTASRYLLDSSVWLAHLKGESMGAVEYLQGSDSILASVISLYEIVRKLKNAGVNEGQIVRSVKFLKEHGNLCELTSEISIKAAQDSVESKLHAIDALIYRTALENKATLVTMDYDFHKLPGVKIIKQ